MYRKFKINKMGKLFEGCLIGLVAIIVVGVIAVFGGTIVWLIWPTAVQGAFPGLVESGAIAGNLSWGQAVCLTWLFGLLIKATFTNNHSNKN